MASGRIEGFGMAPMLLVTPWYKPTIGGVAEVADRLHTLLERSGVETHLLVCDMKGSRNVRADGTGHNLWRIKIPSSIMYNNNPRSLLGMLLHAPGVVRELARFVRERRIGTVFLLFPIDYVWPFLVLRCLTDLKIIASYHGNDLTRYESYPSILRYLMRRTLLSADAITVCASHLAMIARKIVSPNTLENIHLIANCVDAERFLPPRERPEKRSGTVTLVHVSNFNPKKRTKDIVQAFAMASLPAETSLIMVGQGPDFVEARRLAENLGVGGRVAFAGAQQDVRPYLWGADIFVLASDDEGAPLVLLEAMAAGLAWISTPWGAAEQLPPGECGLVVPAGSPEKLAAAMEELVGDPEKRKSMGRRGRERAESDFDVSTYIQKHRRLIQLVQGISSRDCAPCTSSLAAAEACEEIERKP